MLFRSDVALLFDILGWYQRRLEAGRRPASMEMLEDLVVLVVRGVAPVEAGTDPIRIAVWVARAQRTLSLAAQQADETREARKRARDALGVLESLWSSPGLPEPMQRAVRRAWIEEGAKLSFALFITHIFVGVATESRTDGAALASRLSAAGYQTVDLSDNEMAKLHVRHMVGGRAPDVRHERLCRFEFPERPGALTNFLENLAGRWNISLFHYRNQGADYGRILVGLQVPKDEVPRIPKVLDKLGYVYVDETRNPVYRLFLR